MRCYWEHIGEHIENLWNIFENTLGTKKIQKIQHPPLPALPLFAPKEIKTEPLGCMFAKQLFNLKFPFENGTFLNISEDSLFFITNFFSLSEMKISTFLQKNMYIYIYIVCVCVCVDKNTFSLIHVP